MLARYEGLQIYFDSVCQIVSTGWHYFLAMMHMTSRIASPQIGLKVKRHPEALKIHRRAVWPLREEEHTLLVPYIQRLGPVRVTTHKPSRERFLKESNVQQNQTHKNAEDPRITQTINKTALTLGRKTITTITQGPPKSSNIINAGS
jgi:hypothetical protein